MVWIFSSPGESGMLAAYFDIAMGSQPGTEVSGRINLEENRFLPERPITQNVVFEITGGTGAQVFSLQPYRDPDGRVFGVLKLKPGQAVDRLGEQTLNITLAFDGAVVESKTISVHVNPQTFLERVYQDVRKFADSEPRMRGRTYSDQDVASLITQLERGNSLFPDVRYTDPGAPAQYGDNLEEICIRLGGLGHAYSVSKVYGEGGNSPPAREKLKSALYLAIEGYVDKFPVKDFTLNPALQHNDRSHQWRFTDAFIGMAIKVLPSLRQDLQSSNASLASQATRVFGKVLKLHSISFEFTDLPQVPTDLKRFAGEWADANRFHRMRTWLSLMAFMSDYNRPITYVGYWYPGWPAFRQNPEFRLLPGWTPTGSFEDMRTWIKTNYRETYKYGNEGFLPDGTISHHSTTGGQEMSMVAYGFEWLTELVIHGMDWFSDSPWQLENEAYNTIADWLLYPYDRLIYKDRLDIVTTGRSFLGGGLSQFGSLSVQPAINRLLAAKSKTTVIARESELTEFGRALTGNTHEYSGNIPFWNADFMVHRRGGKGEAPYYMSVKMNSARTRGVEEFTATGYAFHTGDGFFQVLRDGREYDRTLFNWDWHALPGITAELRTDALPVVAPAFKDAPGTNTFAGVASDGRYGMAAFELRRPGNYATAAADKAYFFSEKEAVFLGSKVKRTQSGQNRPILSTLNQTRWSTDITYDLGDGTGSKTIARGSSGDRTFNVSKNSWFHQDGVGYVVLPFRGPSTVRCIHGDAVKATEPRPSGDVDVFHLAVDHGTNPGGTGPSTEYAYIVTPNITASEMPQYVAGLGQRVKILRNDEIKAVHFEDIKMVQASFQVPGSVVFREGLTLAVNQPALVMAREDKGFWQFSLTNPNHSLSLGQIAVNFSAPVVPGIYRYRTQGIVAKEAESVEVSKVAGGSTLVFQLPDRTDEQLYQYREEMFAGMPIHVNFSGNAGGTLDANRGRIRSAFSITGQGEKFSGPIGNIGRIRILDASGKIIKVIQSRNGGFEWNGEDSRHKKVRPGVYYATGFNRGFPWMER